MEKQYVIFTLGKEQYGIDIAAVETIVKIQEITKVPYTPPYMEGITNLRGEVVPIIDLAKRFNLEVENYTNETRIIVLLLNGFKVGMIVSAVTEVISIDESMVETPPTMLNSINSEFIFGIAKIEMHLVILLDIESILTQKEKKDVVKILPNLK